MDKHGDQLTELIKKMVDEGEKSERDRKENWMYGMFAFALATFGLALAVASPPVTGEKLAQSY